MYIIQDSKKYYLKDLYTGELYEFAERQLFIAYLKYVTNFYKKNGSCNTYMESCFLDSLNVSGNDITNYYRHDYIKGNPYLRDKETYLKRYLFFDENYVIVDIRILQNEIIKCQDDYFQILPKNIKDNKHKRNSFNNKQRNSFEFRKDPVPYCGSNRKGRSSRSPKIKQSKVQASILEYKVYIRLKRSNNSFPDFYDCYRSNWKDKCWKDCRKIKKQWMKKVI